MQSFKDSIKGLDLEGIRRRAEQNRLRAANSDGSEKSVEKNIKCRKCNDELGFFTKQEHPGRDYLVDVWVQCACVEEYRRERMFATSRITDEFRSKSFDDFKTDGRPQVVIDAKYCTESYFDDFEQIRDQRKNSIALLGIPGCGKTHLLMAVANGLIKHGIPTIYFPWVEGFNELKDNLDELDERIGLLQRIDVLYIDDMWKGRKEPTPFQIEQAFAIINYRYLNKLPILVSSEYDIDAMCRFDMAIGSRIYEMCKDYCVVIHGAPKQLNFRLLDD